MVRSLLLAILYFVVMAIAVSTVINFDTPQPVHRPSDPGYCGERGVTPPHLKPGSRKPSVYPPEAIRADEEGVTTLDFRIDSLGKVGDVKIAQSSGYSTLDQAAVTETIAQSYDPATFHGRRIPCRKLEKITWKLTGGGQPSLSYANIRNMGPNDYPPHALASGEEGTTDIQLIIDENGKIVNSMVSRSSGFGDLDAAALDRLYASDKITAATLSGKPIRTVSFFEFHWSLAPQSGQPSTKVQ